MKLTIAAFKVLIKEALEKNVDDEVEELRTLPEYADVDSFATFKLENDDYEFSVVELHALARNITQSRMKGKRHIETASPSDVAAVRQTLEKEMGFKYVVRSNLKQTRGFTSPAHGTNRWAGMGGGGSGFGSDFGGSTFTSFGGGPGAMGGGYDWDANDPKNLGMGAKKKR